MDFPEILAKLVEIQKTDSGLDELDRIKKGFHQQVAGLEGQVAVLQSRIQEEKKLQEDLFKQRKGLEMEVGALENKIKKYLGQQDEVKNNEQYAALKQEIDKSREEKGRIEERILEIMFKEDERKARIQDLTRQLGQAERKVAEDKVDYQQKISDCEKASREKKTERAKQLSELPTDFVEGYEQLRNSGKKIAVAEAQEDQTCSGCHMNIPPQILNELRKNIMIQRCACGRYLYHKD